MDTLILLLLLAVLVWFWIDSLNAREKAVKAAFVACRQIGLQFLDQTVALQKIKLARNKRGRLVLQRHYGFEFSAVGVERRRGQATLLGQQLKQIQLEEGENTLIFADEALKAAENSTKEEK